MKKNVIVKFRDEDHSYWHGKTKYTSVNGLLGNFGFEFDRDFWLVYKGIESILPDIGKRYFACGFNFADRKPSPETLIEVFQHDLDLSGSTIEELTAIVSDTWDNSATTGTEFHNYCEDKAYDDGFIVNPYDGKEYTIREKPKISKGFDNTSNLNFLRELKDGSYAELLVFSKEHRISGQADEVFIETIDGVRYVDIGDHKTNRKKPEYKKGSNGTCFYPIDHLYDCTYTKYWLQVSMYAHLLERLGYVVRNVGFYHYENYDYSTKDVVKMKYLGRECKDLLDIHLHYMES